MKKRNNIRKWAQGHDAGCQIRLPGCAWGPTVGVHIPSGLRYGKGIGRKPDDILMALACDNCHSIIDGRTKTDMEKDFIRLAFHEGLAATLLLRKQADML